MRVTVWSAGRLSIGWAKAIVPEVVVTDGVTIGASKSGGGNANKN